MAGKQPEAETARSDIKSALRMSGAQVYEPANAWSLDIYKSDPDQLYKLSDINFYALDQADLVVAVAPPMVKSVGVPIEVYHTLMANDAPVGIWFGPHEVLGAMWTYLLREFENRVYSIPDRFSNVDIAHLVSWAASSDRKTAQS